MWTFVRDSVLGARYSVRNRRNDALHKLRTISTHLLVGLVLAVATVPGEAAGQKPPVALGRALLWIHAARMHTPGTLDQPLLDVAGWDANAFDSVRRNLKAALARMHEDPAKRNDILRRGMLLHTDIAILTPDRAARFTRLPDPPRSEVTRGRAPQTDNSVTVGMDGQYLGSIDVTAHWMFARALASVIHPDPADDPFVARWYRATTAYFEIGYRLGIAFPHLSEALKVFPGDPWLLFYKAAMHEALAAPRYQNIARSQPRIPGRPRPLDEPGVELERAESYYHKATQADPSFAEARLRLGRVMGQRGQHAHAIEELQRALALTGDVVQQYYANLFLAAEFEAVDKRDEARAAYERSTELFPAAQAPLIGLSELARRSGDRDAALAALARIRELPPDSANPIDPWWVYFRQYAWNAERLLDALRQPFIEDAGR